MIETNIDKIFQVAPGLDFNLEDLVKVDEGYPEGFYVERYAPLELKGKKYSVFKRDLCGRVKYFATLNSKIGLRTIAKVLS